jgi:ABC-type Zn uptake system ZnuABC Zn-binding protein ZnuA
MKTSIIRLCLLVLIIIPIIGISIFLTNRKPATPSSPLNRQPLVIAATINPLADMVRQIGGQDVEVITILPPGASPHTFEPTPEQIRQLQGVKLIMVIGHGFDDWSQVLAQNLPGARLVSVDSGVPLRQLPTDQVDPDMPNQNQDPHYWLSATNAKIMAKNIADLMDQTDPVQKQTHAANLATFTAQLDEMDRDIKAELSGLTHKELITHHNAWGYFADAYGLKVVGTFEISPGKEPTPQQIADLQAKVKQYGIRTIFSEPQLSDQSLRPFTQDLNLRIAVLDPEGGSHGMGYIELMRYNADTIANTLK